MFLEQFSDWVTGLFTRFNYVDQGRLQLREEFGSTHAALPGQFDYFVVHVVGVCQCGLYFVEQQLSVSFAQPRDSLPGCSFSRAQFRRNLVVALALLARERQLQSLEAMPLACGIHLVLQHQ